MAAPEPTWEMSTLGHLVLPAGTALPQPAGPCWVYDVAGEITLDTASGLHTLSTGDAVLIDARTAFRVTASGPEQSHLAVADLRVVVTTQRLPSPMVVRGFDAASAGVAALVTKCPLENECAPTTVAASYGNLVGTAMTTTWLARQGRDAVEVVDDVVAAVAARPGEAWTVERMARLAHLSRSALGDRFRRSLGLGPSELLREVRMREARRLLRDPSRPVAHVAYAVGYGSTAAFSRAFSSQHGMGPQASPQGRRTLERYRTVERHEELSRTEDRLAFARPVDRPSPPVDRITGGTSGREWTVGQSVARALACCPLTPTGQLSTEPGATHEGLGAVGQPNVLPAARRRGRRR